MVLVEGCRKGIMLGDEPIKPKVTTFSRATVYTSNEVYIPVNNIHMHYHDIHL